MGILARDIYVTLSDIPLNRRHNIAIYGGVTPETNNILIMAINERIRVKYFVNCEKKYDGANIFNIEIINKADLLKDDEIYVIVEETFYYKDQEWIEKHLSGRYYVVKPGKITEKIQNSHNLYIYGAGDAGRRTLEVLKNNHIRIQGFIDSDSKKIGQEWYGHLIYGKDVLEEDDVVIVSTIYYAEIVDDLSRKFNNYNILVDYRNSRVSAKAISYSDMNSFCISYRDYSPIFLQNVDYLYAALWNDFENKKIILYGKNEIAQQLLEIFDLLGYKVSSIVDDDITTETNEGNCRLYNVYDLAYVDLSNTIVIITKVDDSLTTRGMIVYDSGEILNSIGIEKFKQWRPIKNINSYERKLIPDHLLDYVLLDSNVHQDLCGYYIHGSSENAKRKIVVLGGSTSDALFYGNLTKSWSECLARKLENTVIYNGGISAYSSVQECLKLLRDVVHLQPDLIISYSGINDYFQTVEKYPFIRSTYYKPNLWYGLENSFSHAEYWILMEKYMRALSEVNGCDFIGILQPGSWGKKDEDFSIQEKRYKALFEVYEDQSSYKEYENEVKKKILEYSWIYDLTDVFSGIKETVYKDRCHLNEYGNMIVADKIREIIDDYYAKKQMRITSLKGDGICIY